MPEYKLYYFNFKGRAETIRLLFAAAGQKYEDIRFEHDNWSEFKAKSPFGECPYLEVVDGSNVVLRLGQSITIARYLARKFGLAGKDENEQAFVDMYADQLTDTTNHLVKAITEKDETKKAEINKKLIEDKLPNNLKFFEEQLQRSGSGFIAPSGLTYVDAFLFAFLEWLDEKKPIILEKFPHIKAFDDKFSQIPGVAEWLKTRPVTKM